MAVIDPFDIYMPLMGLVEQEIKETHKEYLKTVFYHLQLHPPLTLNEVLERTGKSTVEEIETAAPYRFFNPKDAQGNSTSRWYDLEPPVIVTPNTHKGLYQSLFCFKLRQLDLLHVFDFLDYHLTNYFDNKLEAFTVFLIPQVHKHKNSLLDYTYISIIEAWIGIKRNSLGEPAVKTKGKPPRTPEDQRTVLTLDQTVVLLYFMRELRFFDKDEYLNNKSAGIGFATLTGFNPDAIRVKLGEVGNLMTTKNIKEVLLQLTRLHTAIKAELKENC